MFTRMAVTKEREREREQVPAMMWKNWNSCTQWECENPVASMENNTAIPQKKLNIELPHNPACPQKK